MDAQPDALEQPQPDITPHATSRFMMHASRAERMANAVFIWPAVLVMLLLSIFPLIISAYLSLSRFQLVKGGFEIKFVGWLNYRKLLFGSEQTHFFGALKPPGPLGWLVLAAVAGLLIYGLARYLRGRAVTAGGLAVEWILETHVHADHLSAAPYLQDRLGGRIGIGANITVVQETFGKVFNEGTEFQRDGSQFDRLFREGDGFTIGALQGHVLHTPGHTPACLTYVIGDAAFVGDTLFMPDFGTARCDFPGGSAGMLYNSIQKILALPDALFHLVARLNERGYTLLDTQWLTPHLARFIYPTSKPH